MPSADDITSCPDHGDPAACPDECTWCPCSIGEHARCGRWYDGCCCHNLGPQPFGQCPDDRRCGHPDLRERELPENS
jgi:hypothetical protein